MASSMPNIQITRITDSDYKNIKGFSLVYGTGETQFGNLLVAMHEDKLCYAAFHNYSNDIPASALADLKNEFPNAALKEDNGKIKSVIDDLFKDQKSSQPVKLMLKGTDFQTRVWEQIISLKKGSTYSYEDVAKALSNPKAIRAVAKAVSSNKLAYIVPCHRVISKSGGLSKYKWGAERKLKILNTEGALKTMKE